MERLKLSVNETDLGFECTVCTPTSTGLFTATTLEEAFALGANYAFERLKPPHPEQPQQAMAGTL